MVFQVCRRLTKSVLVSVVMTLPWSVAARADMPGAGSGAAPVSVPQRLPAFAEIVPPEGAERDAVDPVVAVLDFVAADSLPEAVRETLRRDARGRPVTARLLDDIWRAVDHYYQSTARMPGSGVVAIDVDADAPGARVTVNVVEGRLGQVRTEGMTNIAPGYVERVIEPLRDGPLRFDALDRVLKGLQADPRFAAVNGALVPSQTLGVVDLELRVTEADPWSAQWRLANDRPPSVGAERLTVTLGNHALNERGDEAYLRIGTSGEGGDLFGAGYLFALAGPRTVLDLHWQRDDSVLIEAPFNSLDITAVTRSASVGIRHWQTLDATHERHWRVALAHRDSQTRLLGTNFSFSAGANDGAFAVTALEGHVEETWRSPNRALSLRGGVVIGLDALGATINDGRPDGTFALFRGAASVAWLLRRDVSFSLAADFQLADRALLPSEQYALGGDASVRGFRSNRLVRDNGARIGAVLETALSPPPGVPGTLGAFAFTDWGRAWNDDDRVLASDTLMSVGVGFTWRLDERLGARLALAKRVTGTSAGNADLQDRGVHFALHGAW